MFAARTFDGRKGASQPEKSVEYSYARVREKHVLRFQVGKSEDIMATTPVSQSLNRGGSFLISSITPEEIFTPADLSDDQRLIGQTAEEFVAKEVVPLIPELEQHKEGLMAQTLKKAGEMGLLGGAIPEEYGGAGLDKISATVLAEKLAVYASFAVSHGGHAGIGTIPIVYFGTEAQKKKYLPKIASGEWLSCYCLSEPQAGSDALASRTRAVLSPDGKNWILNGQKMWITNGGFADVYVVFAKVDGEKFSCFIVERGTPGFTAGAEEKKMGIRGSSTVPLFFENAAIPKENLLHEIGRGHIVAFNTLNVGTIFARRVLPGRRRRKCWKCRRSMRRSGRPSAKRFRNSG